jgi:uncharacterized protein with HEPN domain
MHNEDITYDTVSLIIETINITLQRTKHISSPVDFTTSELGMILMDSTCMKLAAIGESIKNLDKITNKNLLNKYPQINWKQAMGMRDIIVHHYFDIDVDVIFKTLYEDIPTLLDTLEKIQTDISRNK